MESKKQEITSLLEKMDEEHLDWLLYLIKLRPIKEEKIRYVSNPEAKEIWDKVRLIIKQELTEVSYNTWIKNIIPIEVEENVLKLAVESEFQLGILKGRYSNLIITALFFLTDIKFDLEYVVDKS